jgi:predicted aspartyl protease
MTLLSIVFLLPLLAQAPPPAAPAAQPASVAAAQTLLATGDAAGARKILEAVVAANPSDGPAWNAIGTVCLGPRLKDYDCAVAALTKVLALRPDDPAALLSMGVAYAAKGDTEHAFSFLSRARASRRIDMTPLSTNPLVEPLRKDPRYAALMPTAADFENPFVEPTKIINEWHGENAGDGFGWIARSIGDVDGDRAEDFVTSSPSFGAAGSNMGRIYVYSSRSGRLLWTADGAAGDRLGVGIEAAGDVNGDGKGDVIGSAPGGAYAKVYDGQTGAVLLSLKAGAPTDRFGAHVSGIGDVNGDKVPDLIVGAPGGPQSAADYTGRAYVFSGKDGAVLFTFKGDRGGDAFGSAVSGATVAGKTTIIIGAGSGGPDQTGRAAVYHSLSDTPAFYVDGDATDRALAAMFVGVPGDLDGDGVQDVYASDWNGAAKGPGTGRVYLHSGKTGTLLFDVTGENAGDNLGSTQAIAGDVDGDGTPDLILGAWQYGGAAVSGGRAYLYSGKTGQLLKTYTNRVPGDTFTFDGVGIGDVDGDGIIDLLITGGGSAINGFRSGRVFLMSSGVERPKTLRQLYDARNYFALRDRLREFQADASPDTEFFRAVVDSAFNRLEASNRRLERLLGAGTVAPLRDDLLILKRRNDLRLYRYADAAAGAQALLAANTAPPDQLQDAANVARMFNAVADVPRQTSRRVADTRLTLVETKLGGHCAPVRIGTLERCYILDTGANLSVLMRSEALALGLEIRPAGVDVGTASDVSIKADMASADPLRIGAIEYRNVVFLVMPDAALSFPDGHRIPGILGFPVIEAMGEVRFDGGSTLTVPMLTPARPAETMALHQLMPLTQVGYDGAPLLCRVDTGADTTSFYQPFFAKRSAAIERVGTPITAKVGGVGGIRDIAAFRLPETRVTVALRTITLPNPEVYTASIAGNASENFLDCNLGLDAMRRGGAYGFNFRSMSLLIDDDGWH